MHMRMVRLYDAAPRRSAPVRLPAAVAPREQRAPAQKPSWLLTQGSRQPCGLGAAAWLCCSATVEAAGSTQPELTRSVAAQGPHRVALRLHSPPTSAHAISDPQRHAADDVHASTHTPALPHSTRPIRPHCPLSSPPAPSGHVVTHTAGGDEPSLAPPPPPPSPPTRHSPPASEHALNESQRDGAADEHGATQPPSSQSPPAP